MGDAAPAAAAWVGIAGGVAVTAELGWSSSEHAAAMAASRTAAMPSHRAMTCNRIATPIDARRHQTHHSTACALAARPLRIVLVGGVPDSTPNVGLIVTMGVAVLLIARPGARDDA